MEKAKQKNPYIWKRMGLELAALDTLIVRIQCDPDYCDVMDKQTLRRLYRLAKNSNILRSAAENRMAWFVPDWSTDTFYPVDREKMNAAISNFRESLRQAVEHE